MNSDKPLLLRTVALAAVLIGAVGSVGLMLRAGHRNESGLLLAVFTIWVLSPFMALALADVVSKRWSAPARTTVYGVMLTVTLGSLAVYGVDALVSLNRHAAFVFIVVPAASLLLIAIVLPIASRISRRLAETSR
jgi:galactitol-specific phosphotransferase system IIC component